MRIKAITTSSIAVAATLASATPALAQEGRGGLQDIVVTARKVEENLQSVPVAITAFNNEALEQQSAVQLSDVARLAPGLTIISTQTNGSSIAFFTLRGQTQRSNLATTDPSVGVYVDGVYWARAYGINANLLDVSNLQVLRGPQGTLFGRNTTGGAILIETNNPKLDEFSGKVKVGAGRFDRIEGTAVVNAPISDNVAARLAFQMIDDKGYIKNPSLPQRTLGDEGSYAMRAKLLTQFSDRTNLILSADIYREDKNPYTGELLYVQPTSSSNLNAAAELIGAGACFADIPACSAQGSARVQSIIAGFGKDRNVPYNIVNQTEARTDTFTGTLNHDAGFGDLKVIASYRQIFSKFYSDYDGSEMHIAEYSGVNDINQWSVEAQLTGKALADRLSYAAGVFYFEEQGNDRSDFAAVTAINSNMSRFDGDIDNKAIGIYAQGDFDLTDQLSITAGLRWSQDKKAVTIRNGSVAGDIYNQDPATFVCRVEGGGCPSTRKGKFDGFSWTIGLNFEPTPDILVYVKAARAFRSGGVNLRETTQVNNLPPTAFKPEQATSFEGGIKADLFNRRVRFNLAGYYMTLDDAQREFILSTVVGTRVVNTTVAGNAGQADFYGGEAELTAKVIDTATNGLTLSANASYTKPKYKDYVNPQDGFDKSREEFPFIPKWTLSVSGNFEHQFEAAKLNLTATYNWSSQMFISEYNYYTDSAGITHSASDGSVVALQTAIDTKDSATIRKNGTLDARAAFAFGDDEQYEVAIWGKNVLNDRAVLMTGTVFTLGVPGVRRKPTTWGVTGTVKF